MAINARVPQATMDGTQTGIVDTSMPSVQGDFLTYDASKKMYVPVSSAALTLSRFTNDLDIISLAEVNAAIDASIVANAGVGGGEIDLSSYATDAEVAALFASYTHIVDYTEVTNTPDLSSYTTASYVDQQVAAINVFSGNYTDLINAPAIFSGSYSDLTNQPIIPSIDGLASTAYVDQQIAAVTHPVVDLTGYALTTSIPTVPVDISDLTDTTNLLTPVVDLSGYSTVAYVDQQVLNAVSGQVIDLTGYVTDVELATGLVPYALSADAFSGNYVDLVGKPTNLVTTGHLTNTLASYQPSVDLSAYALKTEVFSGSYTDLTSLPTLFSGNFADLIGTPVIFSGSYSDLTNQPIIPSITGLASVVYVDQQVLNAVSGQVIDLSGYVTDVELASAVAALPSSSVSSYNDLTDVAIDGTETINHVVMYNGVNSLWENVDLSVSFVTKSFLTQQLSSALTNSTFSLDGYATTSYIDQKLIERGAHFSSDYNDLTNSPNLFSGDYNDLYNTPGDLATSMTMSLVGSTLSLSNGSPGVDLSTISIDYSLVTNSPTLFSGNYNDLINLPTLFSGDYNDLSNRPYIPSIAGLATELYVNNKHAEPVVIGDKTFTGNITFEDFTLQKVSTVSHTAQKREYVMAVQTTNNIVTEVLLGDASRIGIAQNATAMFKVTYVASGATEQASFVVRGIVDHTSSINLIGSNITETIADNDLGWSGTVGTNGASGSLAIYVHGSALSTVDWTVFCEISEVIR